MQILAIVGSLGASSSNRQLLQDAVAAAPPEVNVVLFEQLGTLPFFDPDIENNPGPAPVQALRAAIATSDAVLIAAPEYGHSLPGVLKNALDWLIGSGELERKVVAITASVNHTERGRKGLAALNQTLAAVSAQIIDDGPIVRGAEAAPALRKLLEAIVAAVHDKKAE